MKKLQIIDTYNECILNTYTRTDGIFVKGKGTTLTDIDGKKYLDFFPGWGVANVGHCHPKVMAGVRDQIGKLIHIPNNFYHPFQAKLAKEIIRHSFEGKLFFCNSGAEANEGAIKFARIYGGGKRHEIITTQNSFHGRTLAALAATGQPKYHAGFEPMPTGFVMVPFNNLEAVQKAVNEKTVAILLELVQGEGGINIASKEYVQGLRKICDEKNILLIIDEVQTGMGRTGEMFAFKHYGVTPDVMPIAKSLGGGLPIGAFVIKKSIADILKPGMHGSTYGGSPLVCKAALGVFAAIKSDNMLANTKKMGAYLVGELTKFKQKFACIVEVRSIGLMIGVELNIPGRPVYLECFNHGLIINCTQDKVLRLAPALIVTKKEIDKALFILDKALTKVTSS